MIAVLELGSWSPHPRLTLRLLSERPRLDLVEILNCAAQTSRSNARGFSNFFLKQLISISPAPDLKNSLLERSGANNPRKSLHCSYFAAQDLEALETRILHRPYDVDAVVTLCESLIASADAFVSASQFEDASRAIGRAFAAERVHLSRGQPCNPPESYRDPLSSAPAIPLFPTPESYLPTRRLLKEIIRTFLLQERWSDAYFLLEQWFYSTGEPSTVWSLLYMAVAHVELAQNQTVRFLFQLHCCGADEAYLAAMETGTRESRVNPRHFVFQGIRDYFGMHAARYLYFIRARMGQGRRTILV